eukprot:CAMPEP_0198489186 /NCGR_PEP_ID=MMETSP1462-20131121/1286_1 /TAXON_ID=1333877 /ORGANISM="Brandtodinium nutriculum, Strain RCC3387" /LENGTH=50 /DNA_ID=CAMNT_0044217679 /DNA_START=107 /DNA_END=255 /DNA_ORIENTATION=+
MISQPITPRIKPVQARAHACAAKVTSGSLWAEPVQIAELALRTARQGVRS